MIRIRNARFTPSRFRHSPPLCNRRAFSLLAGLQNFEYIGGSIVNPATMTAHLLESIHAVSGLSWPGAIVAFTIGMRAILFPAFVKQTKATIMAGNLKDDVAVYQTRIESLKAGGQIAEARQELQEMYSFLKKNNAHPIRTILLSIVPVPIFMSTFFALRNMSKQPIPGFLDGGLAWFTNLAIPDPFYALPILSTVTLLASFEISRKLNPAALSGGMTNLMRALGLVSVPVLSMMPSALCVYFIATNSFTLAQNILLRMPKVRAWLKIPALKNAPLPADNGTKGLFDGIRHRIFKSQLESEKRFIIHSTKPAMK